jgi:hypothetical protein
MTQLKETTIPTLAKQDGWKIANPLHSDYMKDGFIRDKHELKIYFTKPSTLIRLRNEVLSKHGDKIKKGSWEQKGEFLRLETYILEGKYPEAANELAEIINKIEGQ